MENTKMLSVGIDIGTSTTSLIFSHLMVENTAGYFSVPSVSIIDKKVVYQSPVYRTPLVDASLIDGQALTKIIEKEYQTAGIHPSDVETGAVIITGESARKENARMVLEEMSRFAGDFVVSTAGPDLESVIAGQGSGAQHYSEEMGSLTVNLDIGGGTTNVVLFDAGEIVSRGCVDIGGRQLTVDDAGRISYISKSAAKIAAYYNIPLAVGDLADSNQIMRLAEGMSDVLSQLIGAMPKTALLDDVQTEGSETFCIPTGKPIRHVFFSGGVADNMAHPERDIFEYGDIGVLLARAIKESGIFTRYKVVESLETIRATVIGAGTYTTSISGSTITYASTLFPMKNVPVLKLSEEEEAAAWNGNAELLCKKIKWFLSQSDSKRIVLAINGRENPEYLMMKRLSATLAEAAMTALPTGEPLIVIVRMDIAKALGQLLRQTLGGQKKVIAIDEVRVEQNNYVDFGKPIMNGLVVPVVVKTLIFG